MSLFSPAWKGGNEARALASIESCDNQKTLARIAREAPTVERRLAAIRRLTDPDALVAAAVDEGFFDTASLSEDERRKIKNIGSSPTASCRRAAFERLSDPEQILRVVTQLRGRTSFLDEAVKKLAQSGCDMAALAGSPATPYETRLAALGWLSDERLGELAAKEPLSGLRKTIIRRIRDAELRRPYCASEGTHEWEEIDSEVRTVGDTRTVETRLRCRYCGETRSESESYKF